MNLKKQRKTSKLRTELTEQTNKLYYSINTKEQHKEMLKIIQTAKKLANELKKDD